MAQGGHPLHCTANDAVGIKGTPLEIVVKINKDVNLVHLTSKKRV
jgi:hypothetical protein